MRIPASLADIHFSFLMYLKTSKSHEVTKIMMF